jgi:hypothetical protein
VDIITILYCNTAVKVAEPGRHLRLLCGHPAATTGRAYHQHQDATMQLCLYHKISSTQCHDAKLHQTTSLTAQIHLTSKLDHTRSSEASYRCATFNQSLSVILIFASGWPTPCLHMHKNNRISTRPSLHPKVSKPRDTISQSKK